MKLMMMRCAMLLLVLLCVTKARAWGDMINVVDWGNGIKAGDKMTLYCGTRTCHANTTHTVTKISSTPTCLTGGIFEAACGNCHTECRYSINPLGHDWEKWLGSSSTPATCTTPGGRYRTCYRCGTTEYEQRALGHNMSWTTVAATCTTGGYEHGHCQRSGCNYEETRNQTAALGHNFALDHHCTRCDVVDPAKKPEGYIDHCAGGELQFSISGWAYDANAPATSIDIHVYVYQNDGTTPYGDIHIIRADLERPDLATKRGIPTNHGYQATIPIAVAGTYKVKAYAIDLNGDGNPQIGETQTITVTGPSYIAADGTTQVANNATQLTGGAATTLSGGWYYVKGEVNYTGCLTLDGDATIILCDGATLNIGSSESRLTTSCISGLGHNLTVYGQSERSGSLYCYNTTSQKEPTALSPTVTYLTPSTAEMSTFTQYGGNVTFEINVHSPKVAASDPQAVTANVDFYGGHFTANEIFPNGDNGIKGNGIKGAVNISWSSPDDRFRTSGFGFVYSDNHTIAGGKAFTDGTNYITGTLNYQTERSLQNITIWPVTAISLSDNDSNNTAVTKLNGVNSLNVTLTGRTLYKDGAWNTLCLPFDVSTASAPLSGDGVTAMVLDAANSGVSGSTLTLNFTSATSIPAGTPFIIKWNNTGTTIEEPEFTGVTISNASTEVGFSGGKFVGSFSPVAFTANDKSILFLGDANQLYWPNADMTLGACRAHFELSEGSGAREIKLNFEGGESTSIHNAQCTMHNEAGAWYDMQGRKLSQKPTKAGLYIHNGRKVMVK